MITRYDPAAHDVSTFDCRETALNRWLRHAAGQSQRRDAARTFVAVAEHRRVIAYYSIVVAELDHAADGLVEALVDPAGRDARNRVLRTQNGRT